MRWSILVFAAAACSDGGGPGPDPHDTAAAGYSWQIPDGFPIPRVPVDNPMTDDKVELGRTLFYDPRLSGNGRQRCADCHLQRYAFTDGKVLPLGSTGQPGRRNSPSIVNTAYAGSLTLADPTVGALEDQIPKPMFGEDPVELGLADAEDVVWSNLDLDPKYQGLFEAAWPDDPTVTRDRVVDSLAAFVRSVISADSPYDRYLAGDDAAMSDSAKRGLTLFSSERLGCTQCHGTFLLSNNIDYEGLPAPQVVFHNDGLYDIDGTGAYPPNDTGLMRVTGLATDMGRFKPPSLRNVAVTAPYFHDGSAATLDEVIDSYERGGRLLTDGPDAGDGSQNPYKSGFITGFTLTADERADLIEFLNALTDQSLLTNPRWSDPWVWSP